MKKSFYIFLGILFFNGNIYAQNLEKQKIGVTYYNKEKTDDSYRLYSSRNLTTAHLISPAGKYVHTWYYPHKEDTVTVNFGGFGMTWHYAEMLSNGHLIAIVKDEMIIELDWNSNLVWKAKLRAHHDFARDSKGNTIVVSRKDLPNPWEPGKTIAMDELVEFNKKGKIIWQWNYEKHMDDLKNLVKETLPPDETFRDWPHINTCEILPKNPLEKKDKRFKAGNLLLSARHSDIIMIINKKTKKIVWAWGPGKLQGQHMPTMLPNGNILIFDNGHHNSKISRGYTKVVEMNPISKKIVWEYGSNREFFSPARGSAIRLKNGNTLIANSDNGWFFEITPSGEKVWEYYNPDLGRGGHRMGLYRTLAYDKQMVDKLLARNTSMYYKRPGKEKFQEKYGLSDQLMKVVDWIETGSLDEAYRWLNDNGIETIGEKETYFAYSLLFSVRGNIYQSVNSMKKAVEAGMPRELFSREFSDFFKSLTESSHFKDLN